MSISPQEHSYYIELIWGVLWIICYFVVPNERYRRWWFTGLMAAAYLLSLYVFRD